MEKKKNGPLIVFLSSLFWAADSPFRQPILKAGIGAGFIALLEHMFNTLVSLPLLWKNRKQLYSLNLKQLFGLIYIGVAASALAAILFVKGAVLMNYNFTIAALLQKFQPLFAILLAAIFLKEKISLKFWILAIPALIGAYLVTFGAASPHELWASAIGWQGPLLAIFAALIWAGGTVVGRSLLSGLNFEFVTGMRFLFGLIFLVGYVTVWEKMQFNMMTPFFWMNTIIIALLTGFFALFMYYYGLNNTKASVATLMELGYPLALTVVNWKFLGIVLNPWQIVGGLILLGSVTIIVLYGQDVNQTAEHNLDSKIIG
jgi:drug/metabolite transporter (DMT)-like permease